MVNDYERPLRAEIMEIACELRILLRAQHGYKEEDGLLSATAFPPGTQQAVANVASLCGHIPDCTAAFLAMVLQEHIELFAKYYPEVAAFAERVSEQIRVLRAGGTLLEID